MIELEGQLVEGLRKGGRKGVIKHLFSSPFPSCAPEFFVMVTGVITSERHGFNRKGEVDSLVRSPHGRLANHDFRREFPGEFRGLSAELFEQAFCRFSAHLPDR